MLVQAYYKATHSKWISRVRRIYVSSPAFENRNGARDKIGSQLERGTFEELSSIWMIHNSLLLVFLIQRGIGQIVFKRMPKNINDWKCEVEKIEIGNFQFFFFQNWFMPKVTQAYWFKTITDFIQNLYVFRILKAIFLDFDGICCRVAPIGRDYRQKLQWCVRSQGDQYFTKTKILNKCKKKSFLNSRKEPEVPPEKVGQIFMTCFFKQQIVFIPFHNII